MYCSIICWHTELFNVVNHYYCYDYYHYQLLLLFLSLMYQTSPYLRTATDIVPVSALEKFHGFSISRCQSPIQVQNWRTANSSSTAPDCEKARTLSERLPQTYLLRGTITCLALQRPMPVAASCPPGSVQGIGRKRIKKEDCLLPKSPPFLL